MLKFSSTFDIKAKINELIENMTSINLLPNGSRIETFHYEYATPLQLLPIKVLLDKRNISVNPNGSSNPNSQYLQSIGFCNPTFKAQSSFNLPQSKSFIPIQHVCIESLSGADLELKLDMIENHYLNLIVNEIIIDNEFKQALNKNTFTAVLGELIDNVKEHSLANSVYLFSQYWQKRSEFELCLIDDGQGIYNSLKNADRMVLNDTDAIKKVIMNGLSAKDEYGAKYHGTGLKTALSLVTNEFVNGEFLIASGNSFALKESYSSHFKIFEQSNQFQGTIVMLKFRKPSQAFNYLEFISNG